MYFLYQFKINLLAVWASCVSFLFTLVKKRFKKGHLFGIFYVISSNIISENITLKKYRKEAKDC